MGPLPLDKPPQDNMTANGLTSPTFPFELFEEIIHRIDVSYARRDRDEGKNTLRSCSLVCHQWREISQRILFHNINVGPGRASSQDFIRRVAQGEKEASRITKYIKHLRIGGGLGDPRFGTDFPRFAEKLLFVQELQFAWVDAIRWDRLPLHECEAFIRLLWLPSLKTVGVSHVAGYFPLCVSSFFGPNVETLKIERARVMRIITPTLRGNLRAQLAKFHLAFPDTNHGCGIRLKNINLGWKEDITVLVDFASLEFNDFFLDSLQAFTVQREESSADRSFDVGRLFERCPNLNSFKIYPNAPQYTKVYRAIRSGQEPSFANMNRSSEELSISTLHLRRESSSNAFFEWIIPYLRHSPNPGAITRIDIVDTWLFKIYEGDIQGRQELYFLLQNWEQLDRAIISRFHNLKRVCLTLNVGRSCWEGRQDDLLRWLEFVHSFSRLRARGVFVIERNIIPA